MAYDKKYTQSRFRGQIHSPAPVTPFDAKGNFLPEAYEKVLTYHLDVVKCDTMLIAGCNGEGYALTDEELGEVVKVCAKVVGKRVPYFVHVSRTRNVECIRRAEIAAKNGATGIALGQPQIYDSTEARVIERFRDVGKATGLPMMIYNLSHLSHFSLTPAIVNKICDVAPAEVIKDVPTDFDHIKRMIMEAGDRIPVLYGHKDTLVPALLLGGGGFVGTGPEIFGAECRKMFMEVVSMGPKERMEAHYRYGLVSDALMWKIGKPPAGIKAAMNLIGIYAGVPRDHIDPLTPAEEAQLREVFVKARVLAPERIAKRA